MRTEQTNSPLHQIKNFNLSFRDFKIIELSFAINQNYKKWEGEAKGWQGITFEHDIEFEIAFNFNEQEKALSVLLGVNAVAKDAPFNVSIKGIGLFFLDEILEPKQLEIIARINCSAILYPYIREAIADITRRAGFPALHLQPVNFVKMYKGPVEKKENLKEAK